jgi:hypothetical protein
MSTPCGAVSWAMADSVWPRSTVNVPLAATRGVGAVLAGLGSADGAGAAAVDSVLVAAGGVAVARRDDLPLDWVGARVAGTLLTALPGGSSRMVNSRRLLPEALFTSTSRSR